ncbi:MAG: HEAT repeat domain-containing protein [Nibricoccus sp.]
MKTLSSILPFLALCIVLSLFTSSAVGAEGNSSDDLFERCAKLIKQNRSTSMTAANATDAVIALGLSGNEKAVPLLVAEYESQSNNNRRLQVVRALGWLRFPSSLPTLEAAAGDRYQHIPKQAALAISRIKGETPTYGYSRSPAFAPGNCSADAVIEKCTLILTYGTTNSFDGPSKAEAAITLGLLGNERAVPVLADHLLNEENQNLRLQIVRALGWINSRTGVLALESALNDPYVHVRNNAAKVLQQITGKSYGYNEESDGLRSMSTLMGVDRDPLEDFGRP